MKRECNRAVCVTSGDDTSQPGMAAREVRPTGGGGERRAILNNVHLIESRRASRRLLEARGAALEGGIDRRINGGVLWYEWDMISGDAGPWGGGGGMDGRTDVLKTTYDETEESLMEDDTDMRHRRGRVAGDRRETDERFEYLTLTVNSKRGMTTVERDVTSGRR